MNDLQQQITDVVRDYIETQNEAMRPESLQQKLEDAIPSHTFEVYADDFSALSITVKVTPREADVSFELKVR